MWQCLLNKGDEEILLERKEYKELYKLVGYYKKTEEKRL